VLPARKSPEQCITSLASDFKGRNPVAATVYPVRKGQGQRIQSPTPDSREGNPVAAIVSRVVEACVFRIAEGLPEYLILKRSENDNIYPGMWQLVTGSAKDGERADDAALREFMEETGMAAERFWVVPVVNSFYVPVNDTVHLSPVFAVEVQESAVVRLSNEHQEFSWSSFEEAKKKLVWPGQRYAVELVHEYIVGGQEVSRLLSIHL
jgi:8-oxo-dGTP pyrophosphatase MutT (NUDIX family)